MNSTAHTDRPRSRSGPALTDQRSGKIEGAFPGSLASANSNPGTALVLLRANFDAAGDTTEAHLLLQVIGCHAELLREIGWIDEPVATRVAIKTNEKALHQQGEKYMLKLTLSHRDAVEAENGTASAALTSFGVQMYLRFAEDRTRVMPAQFRQQKQVGHEVDDIALGYVIAGSGIAPSAFATVLLEVEIVNLPGKLGSLSFCSHGRSPRPPGPDYDLDQFGLAHRAPKLTADQARQFRGSPIVGVLS